MNERVRFRGRRIRRYRNGRAPGGVVVRLVALSALLLCVLPSWGQYVSRHGHFKVDEVKGCAPFTVTITNSNLIAGASCNAATPCLMNYDGTAQSQNLFSYTYTTPGKYDLVVLYQSIGGDTISITVDQNIHPDYELYTCSSNKVSLKITDKNYDQYYINFGDGSPILGIPSGNNQVANHAYSSSGSYTVSIHGKDLNSADNCGPRTENFAAVTVLPTPVINSLTAMDAGHIQLAFPMLQHIQLHSLIAVDNGTTFQQFKTMYQVDADTVSNINVDSHYYCFKLSSYDPCNNVDNFSNIICSQKFTVTAQSDINSLAWQTVTAGINTFNITRDKGALASTTQLNYDDTSVTCNTNYCYQVASQYTNGSVAYSLTKCVTAFSTKQPTPLNNASAQVTNTDVALEWVPPAAFTAQGYSVYKSTSSGPFGLLGFTPTPDYHDPSYTTDPAICYQVVYTDQCNNFSAPGVSICPIRLTGNLDKRNVVTLSWSDYGGWSNGVQNYTLEKFNKDGNLLLSLAMGTTTTYVDDVDDPQNQVVFYRITATANDSGLQSSISNVIRFIKEVNLFYPTAFTPNGDLLNDGFTVSGHYIASMELRIFDRWGNLIFVTDSQEPWNGTYNGRLMPETTYAWTVTVTDIAQRTTTHTGAVVLLKKK